MVRPFSVTPPSTQSAKKWLVLLHVEGVLNAPTTHVDPNELVMATVLLMLSAPPTWRLDDVVAALPLSVTPPSTQSAPNLFGLEEVAAVVSGPVI